MLRTRLLLPLSLTTALLAGCTTTHYIEIEPTTSIKQEQLHNDRAIKVTTSSSLGNHIGAIKTGLNERADIFTTNNVQESINNSIISGLTKMGFTPDQGVYPPAELNVVITKMSYTTKTKNLKTTATLDFQLTSTVKAKGQTYKANFGSQKVEEYGTLPYQETVQKDMNALVSKTVDRLLSDQNIITLLKP
ncbi:YajG family lipoprotein [Marinomonas pollencensis]|uniref:Putative lipoprotein n=1 Tax=Marinomonas pollencensis TaxID=491954 RepID=A0A3E0DRH8_9GAMM|nr:YajG family lipoprotein [Marinomonas pollencensis]REG85745.1 putative lipoprotein [Marinomonas pollencensis]